MALKKVTTQDGHTVYVEATNVTQARPANPPPGIPFSLWCSWLNHFLWSNTSILGGRSADTAGGGSQVESNCWCQ